MVAEAETPAERHEVTVGEAEAGQRLDRVLAAALAGLSRSRLKSLIESGGVTSGGGTIKEPSYRVKPGQTFAIVVPQSVEAEPQAQAIALDILYEDRDLIVIDKPAGMVVHPALGNPDRTLVNALIAHCGPELAGIGGVRRPGIVHRLDKGTSGVMVAAKTQAAHSGLVEAFAARRIERSYQALVWGAPQPARGEITGNIGRSPRNRKKMAVVGRGGKPAITRYRVLRRLAGGRVSHLECRLLTGRTHQIRVHLSDRGHALLGDPLYGSAREARLKSLNTAARDSLKALGRQALHAASLGFQHPVNQKPLSFVSELPSDMRDLLAKLEEL